jgi:hypothetical protein
LILIKMNRLLRYIFFIVTILAITGDDIFAQVADMRSGLRPSNQPTSQLNRSGRIGTNNSRTSKGKKLEAARNRFISQQLSLTDDEARRFWPVYNQYQQELTAVRVLKRLNNSSASVNGTEQIDKEIAYDNQLVTIRKKYRDIFLKILPPEKVSELYKSEREFTDELIKQLSERSVRAGN